MATETGVLDNPTETIKIRSILKKVSSTSAIDAGQVGGVPVGGASRHPKRSSGKSISFDDNVTTHWSTDECDEDLKNGFDEEGAAKRVSSSSKKKNHRSSHKSHDDSEISEHGDKHSKSKIKLKFKMGNVLRRPGRTQVEGGTASCVLEEAELEASASGLGEDGRWGTYNGKRRTSDMSASVEHQLQRDHHSLPRISSFDSADIFTRSNKSWRSKITKIGKYFKHDRETDDGLPVLTKVTRLGGYELALGLGLGKWTKGHSSG